MATLTLRTVIGRPLTNAEIDGNFTSLNTDVGTRLLATSYNAADVLTKLKTVDGAASGLDADLLDGLHASSFQLASGYNAADVLAKLVTVDGATSGLDADLLDGLHASSFQLANSDASGLTNISDIIGDDIITNAGKILTTDGAGSISWTDVVTLTTLNVTGLVDGRDVSVDGAKLDGIEDNATADQTGAEIKVLYEAQPDTNAFTDQDKTDIADAIAAAALANQNAVAMAIVFGG